jgi:DNA-binding GntR family transcriptional regulator
MHVMAMNVLPSGDRAAETDTGVARMIERVLRERIVAGALPPGAPLRQERVAAEFGASAIPVREALRRLERTGLVVFRPRRGAVVAAVSAAEAREVAEMRAALEPLALGAALPALDAAAFGRAHDAIKAADKSEEVLDWLAANRAFHLALYAPCARPRLLAAIDDLWLAGDRHLVLAWRRLRYQDKSQREHRQILRHCIDGDGRAAEQLLRQHIIAAGEALAEQLAER